MTTTEPAASRLPVDTGAWGARHAHDPTAVRDDEGTYWLFSTDAYGDGPLPRAGVQVRRSADLVTWEFHGWALDGVPADAAAWAGAEGLWAPDVVRVPDDVDVPADERWRMYYSASSFGSRTSAIGLATAPHPAGPWQDRGLVVTSRHEADGPNAIDANAVVDDAGRHWLVYGSFFGGIHALELDPGTGFVIGSGGRPRPGPGLLLARRPHEVEAAVEGAFVLRRPGGGWVLLSSFDSLFDTYHLRVVAGPQPVGPYRDLLGRSATDVAADPVGSAVLAGHRFAGGPGRLAPGHASVLTEPLRDGRERHLLVHHVRDAADPHQHEVQVRRIVWTADGWPLVSPQPWAGAVEQDDDATWPASPAGLAGTWEVVTFARGDVLTDAVPRAVVAADLAGLVAHGAGRFTWNRPGGGAPVEVVVFPSWDAVRHRAALSFAALDTGTGMVSVGTQVAPTGVPAPVGGAR
ncbi:arabinan endo-1,5-alpha-L-arabinosidase [Cellulomonas triticagri]|uniref:Arabinan endo-1,5-alpha-L-arabinosidase n=1 Tax=Cellulomonas triticagri TaxID=2483352 RepID=A0A3M2JLQ8_9CELL|nr:arabinan endo-1,5-alpha-L-arabinosidase [Cellulomonas triticagri]RMI13151.1 arabinan endo-1,5-alpha-L-arabinosidase [Cellulomonas triticagri]